MLDQRLVELLARLLGGRRARRRSPARPSRPDDSAARPTKKTPLGKRSTGSDAASTASRVLPLPPLPVIVTSRLSASAATSACSSRSRPIRRRAGIGRLSGRQRLQRRELGQPCHQRLEQPLRLSQVLQPVLAQAAQLDGTCAAAARAVSDERRSGRRGRRRRYGAAVDVDAHVALLGHGRLAGVQPHPHADAGARQRPLAGDRRLGGALRRRKGDEEGVALGVDLDTAVACEGVSQQRAGARPAPPGSRRRARPAAWSSPRCR